MHDPDDPENKQLATVSLDDQGEIKPKKGEISKSKTSKEIAEDIDIKVMQAYLEGKIKDRDDTILFLVDELKLNVTRITNKGISILPEGKNRPVRLKGRCMSETSRLIEQIRKKKQDEQIAIESEFQEILQQSKLNTATELKAREQHLLNAIDQSNKLIAQKVALLQQQRIEQINQFNNSMKPQLTKAVAGLGALTIVLMVTSLMLFIWSGSQVSQIAKTRQC